MSTILQPPSAAARLAVGSRRPATGISASSARAEPSTSGQLSKPGIETVAVAGRLVEILATAHVEQLDATVTENVSGRTPSFRVGGRDALRQALGESSEAFEDVVVSLEPAGPGPGSYAFEWQIEARHVGTLRVGWAEIEGTGRLVEVEGALLASMRDDRITRFRLYHDEIAVLEQLGLL